jgi:hypothetical protein
MYKKKIAIMKKLELKKEEILLLKDLLRANKRKCQRELHQFSKKETILDIEFDIELSLNLLNKLKG